MWRNSEKTVVTDAKTGLLHEARKLRATALVYVSSIATSAPSTAYAVPLPRVARGKWRVQRADRGVRATAPLDMV